MSSNPLSNLKIDYWYKALIVIGACVLLIALSVEVKVADNTVVGLFALGAIFIGLGEWINHPLQVRIMPGWQFEGYPRRNTVAGNSFDLLGFLFVGFGIYVNF